jgi:AraC-like DNA-binding protein
MALSSASQTVPMLAISPWSARRRVKAKLVYRVDSSGRRNASMVEVSVSTMRERQREVQLYRGQVPSPGRPTVAWREDRVRFWAAISRGLKTADAAREAGVSSPVGFRWFRHAGGVNPCLSSAVSGRYLSFGEREEIALLRAQGRGVREIARRLDRSPSTVSRELRRNASTRTWRLE